MLLNFSQNLLSYAMKEEPCDGKIDMRQAHTICAVGTLTGLKDSCPNPALFSSMTKLIKDDFDLGDKKKKDREEKLGKSLRTKSLAFVGSSELADQANLRRELYLQGLIAAYPIFVIGLLLAIYGVDENGEAKKVIFSSCTSLSGTISHLVAE